MTENRPHRMLVVHNVVTGGDRLGVIEAKPFRRFAFGSLLAHADEVAQRAGSSARLTSDSLALSPDAAIYGQQQLAGVAVAEKYDSVMCHLVLDHGGVLGEDFLAELRRRFLRSDGMLLNPVKSITKTDVAQASQFSLETSVPPCVIKKNNNYNKPETVFEIHTQAELDAWRARTPPEEQSGYVTHQLLRYYGYEQARMHQLERWVVLFGDLTLNYRYSDEFYVKSATSLAFYVRDERSLAADLKRLAASGYAWKGRTIDCTYQHDPAAWDARYAVLKNFRDAFRFDYAELDVIQASEREFVVIDVNQTPGPAHKNVHWRELAVQFLADGLELRP